jgi:hypothetical protein
MADAKEIPQQVADLVELTKRYLRQETIDPLRRIGLSVARGAIVAVLVGLGVVFGAMALHHVLSGAFGDGGLPQAGAAAITAATMSLVAAIVASKIRTGDE